MDERKRESMVAYLRRKMVEFGIKPADIAASLAADQERARAVRYRNAFGHSWDGNGEAPQWVIQAMSAGQSLEHFSIAEVVADELGKHQNTDWCNDPFAGTPLPPSNPETSRPLNAQIFSQREAAEPTASLEWCFLAACN